MAKEALANVGFFFFVRVNYEMLSPFWENRTDRDDMMMASFRAALKAPSPHIQLS